MNTNRNFPIVLVVVVLVVSMLACGLSATATPEPTPTVPAATKTPLPTPTETVEPTSTPRPTATPNLAATQEMEEVLSRVSFYVDSGYLSTTKGKHFELDNFKRELAKMDYLDFDLAGYDNLVRDFAVWADVAWENAGPVNYPQYAGCGFSFRINPDNFDGYTALLTNDRVLLTFCDDSIGICGEVGKTRGSGKLHLDNPAKAAMELIVNNTQAFVLVDDEFIGEYTLSTDRLLDPGYLLYSMISGTNRDFGVRCEVTNSNLWVSAP